MSGLNLVGGVHRIDAAHVVTASVHGVSSGRLAQLLATPWGPAVEERPVEFTDEQGAATGDSRWLRYDVSVLPDGVYRATSIGAQRQPADTYFTIQRGEVGRILRGRRRAERELRRRGRE
jgi:hypothetical protein